MPHSLHKTIIAPALGQQRAHTPLYGHKVEAGFPSPADDYIEDRLSLDEHLIRHRDTAPFLFDREINGDRSYSAKLMIASISYSLPHHAVTFSFKNHAIPLVFHLVPFPRFPKSPETGTCGLSRDSRAPYKRAGTKRE